MRPVFLWDTAIVLRRDFCAVLQTMACQTTMGFAMISGLLLR
jgi:hypothetical protein